MCYNNLRCRFPVQNNFHRGIAQLVEQWSPKPRVPSSILGAPATTKRKGLTVFLPFRPFCFPGKYSAKKRRKARPCVLLRFWYFISILSCFRLYQNQFCITGPKRNDCAPYRIGRRIAPARSIQFLNPCAGNPSQIQETMPHRAVQIQCRNYAGLSWFHCT